ncbi:hypothetical protein SLNWT_5599 [Streptomyces albus]|uniref:PIN like domain-containing protein n=1 Tax=Streptomyces albus (strain ATCC 21838 / DSM 41398 / FERM P-419 / JCM 4703 / NBRC 107858) TaxID=1081613 RepID=A0A0B5F312_STRA4|nr:hypothetical protein SLNWT_5599 [Streptomyces albus]AOU80277.1 hypothetical protein SLNHY_5586 [Streptomyces albus]AYN35990.1 hypothetical protein DUI70_5495 [Streptomyces albus]
MTQAGGLFDGFEGYRTPREEDFQRVMNEGLVVLDTNVLLDLYRMNRRMREDMQRALAELGERLWIPHQVVREFWRNQQQEGVLGHHQAKSRQARADLDKAGESVQHALNRWSKDVHLTEGSPVHAELEQARERFRQALDALSGLIDGQSADDQVPGTPDTHTDPVIAHLERLLSGKVGPPMEPAGYAEAVAEAKRRAGRRQPPGYKDYEQEAKDEEGAAGDYLLWRQLLTEAHQRGGDVLFVTRDLKEDWWRLPTTRTGRLPRVELVDELRREAGGRLFMLEPSGFLAQATQAFALQHTVDERSVAGLRQMETDWDDQSVTQVLLELLRADAGAQFQVILHAGRNGGLVDRDTVYRLSGYGPERSLRGFTRPVHTATRRVQERGVIPQALDDLLSAVHDSDDGPATGFRVADAAHAALQSLPEVPALDAGDGDFAETGPSSD